MKIAVLSTKVPFVRGGAEELQDELVAQLRAHGHEAEPIQLAFQWHPARRVLDHMLAARLTRIDGVDRVIALKFPAYYVPHDDKVVWLLHQFRQAYDLWGGPFQDLPDTLEGRSVRAAVIAADNSLLPQARRIFVNSEVTRERLWHYNGIASRVLLPPVINPGSYRTETPDGYLFAGGRINAAKRQSLLVEAMSHVRSGVRLVIAGPPETPAAAENLRRLVSEHELGDRVELLLRWLSHEEKVALLAGSVAAAYVPVDEDSYGYVTLEALHARKPVVTCADSGGTLTLVRHGLSGFVAEPEPRALADAIDSVASDQRRAVRMGEDGRSLLDMLALTWDHTVRELTA